MSTSWVNAEQKGFRESSATVAGDPQKYRARSKTPTPATLSAAATTNPNPNNNGTPAPTPPLIQLNGAQLKSNTSNDELAGAEVTSSEQQKTGTNEQRLVVLDGPPSVFASRGGRTWARTPFTNTMFGTDRVLVVEHIHNPNRAESPVDQLLGWSRVAVPAVMNFLFFRKCRTAVVYLGKKRRDVGGAKNSNNSNTNEQPIKSPGDADNKEGIDGANNLKIKLIRFLTNDLWPTIKVDLPDESLPLDGAGEGIPDHAIPGGSALNNAGGGGGGLRGPRGGGGGERLFANSDIEAFITVKNAANGRKYVKLVLRCVRNKIFFDVMMPGRETQRWEERRLHIRMLDNLESKRAIESYSDYVSLFREACAFAKMHSAALEASRGELIEVRYHHQRLGFFYSSHRGYIVDPSTAVTAQPLALECAAGGTTEPTTYNNNNSTNVKITGQGQALPYGDVTIAPLSPNEESMRETLGEAHGRGGQVTFGILSTTAAGSPSFPIVSSQHPTSPSATVISQHNPANATVSQTSYVLAGASNKPLTEGTRHLALLSATSPCVSPSLIPVGGVFPFPHVGGGAGLLPPPPQLPSSSSCLYSFRSPTAALESSSSNMCGGKRCPEGRSRAGTFTVTNTTTTGGVVQGVSKSAYTMATATTNNPADDFRISTHSTLGRTCYRLFEILSRPESTSLDYKSYYANPVAEILDKCVPFMCGFLNSGYRRGKLVIGVHEVQRRELPATLLEELISARGGSLNGSFASGTAAGGAGSVSPSLTHTSYRDTKVSYAKGAGGGGGMLSPGVSPPIGPLSSSVEALPSGGGVLTSKEERKRKKAGAGADGAIIVHNDQVEQVVVGIKIDPEGINTLETEISSQLEKCIPPIPPHFVKLDFLPVVWPREKVKNAHVLVFYAMHPDLGGGREGAGDGRAGDLNGDDCVDDTFSSPPVLSPAAFHEEGTTEDTAGRDSSGKGKSSKGKPRSNAPTPKVTSLTSPLSDVHSGPLSAREHANIPTNASYLGDDSSLAETTASPTTSAVNSPTTAEERPLTQKTSAPPNQFPSSILYRENGDNDNTDAHNDHDLTHHMVTAPTAPGDLSVLESNSELLIPLENTESNNNTGIHAAEDDNESNDVPLVAIKDLGNASDLTKRSLLSTTQQYAGGFMKGRQQSFAHSIDAEKDEGTPTGTGTGTPSPPMAREVTSVPMGGSGLSRVGAGIGLEDEEYQLFTHNLEAEMAEQRSRDREKVVQTLGTLGNNGFMYKLSASWDDAFRQRTNLAVRCLMSHDRVLCPINIEDYPELQDAIVTAQYRNQSAGMVSSMPESPLTRFSSKDTRGPEPSGGDNEAFEEEEGPSVSVPYMYEEGQSGGATDRDYSLALKWAPRPKEELTVITPPSPPLRVMTELDKDGAPVLPPSLGAARYLKCYLVVPRAPEPDTDNEEEGDKLPLHLHGDELPGLALPSSTAPISAARETSRTTSPCHYDADCSSRAATPRQGQDTSHLPTEGYQAADDQQTHDELSPNSKIGCDDRRAGKCTTKESKRERQRSSAARHSDQWDTDLLQRLRKISATSNKRTGGIFHSLIKFPQPMAYPALHILEMSVDARRAAMPKSEEFLSSSGGALSGNLRRGDANATSRDDIDGLGDDQTLVRDDDGGDGDNTNIEGSRQQQQLVSLQQQGTVTLRGVSGANGYGVPVTFTPTVTSIANHVSSWTISGATVSNPNRGGTGVGAAHYLSIPRAPHCLDNYKGQFFSGWPTIPMWSLKPQSQRQGSATNAGNFNNASDAAAGTEGLSSWNWGGIGVGFEEEMGHEYHQQHFVGFDENGNVVLGGDPIAALATSARFGGSGAMKNGAASSATHPSDRSIDDFIVALPRSYAAIVNAGFGKGEVSAMKDTKRIDARFHDKVILKICEFLQGEPPRLGYKRSERHLLLRTLPSREVRAIRATCRRFDFIISLQYGLDRINPLKESAGGEQLMSSGTTRCSHQAVQSLQLCFAVARISKIPLLLAWVFEHIGALPSPFPFIAAQLTDMGLRPHPQLIPLYYVPVVVPSRAEDMLCSGPACSARLAVIVLDTNDGQVKRLRTDAYDKEVSITKVRVRMSVSPVVGISVRPSKYSTSIVAAHMCEYLRHQALHVAKTARSTGIIPMSQGSGVGLGGMCGSSGSSHYSSLTSGGRKAPEPKAATGGGGGGGGLGGIVGGLPPLSPIPSPSASPQTAKSSLVERESQHARRLSQIVGTKDTTACTAQQSAVEDGAPQWTRYGTDDLKRALSDNSTDSHTRDLLLDSGGKAEGGGEGGGLKGEPKSSSPHVSTHMYARLQNAAHAMSPPSKIKGMGSRVRSTLDLAEESDTRRGRDLLARARQMECEEKCEGGWNDDEHRCGHEGSTNITSPSAVSGHFSIDLCPDGAVGVSKYKAIDVGSIMQGLGESLTPHSKKRKAAVVEKRTLAIEQAPQTLLTASYPLQSSALSSSTASSSQRLLALTSVHNELSLPLVEFAFVDRANRVIGTTAGTPATSHPERLTGASGSKRSTSPAAAADEKDAPTAATTSYPLQLNSRGGLVRAPSTGGHASLGSLPSYSQGMGDPCAASTSTNNKDNDKDNKANSAEGSAINQPSPFGTLAPWTIVNLLSWLQECSEQNKMRLFGFNKFWFGLFLDPINEVCPMHRGQLLPIEFRQQQREEQHHNLPHTPHREARSGNQLTAALAGHSPQAHVHHHQQQQQPFSLSASSIIQLERHVARRCMVPCSDQNCLINVLLMQWNAN